MGEALTRRDAWETRKVIPESRGILENQGKRVQMGKGRAAGNLSLSLERFMVAGLSHVDGKGRNRI